MPKTTRFDAADYLDTEERQVAYITAALESGDADSYGTRLVSLRVHAAWEELRKRPA
jgi:DNA-binding phage protein